MEKESGNSGSGMVGVGSKPLLARLNVTAENVAKIAVLVPRQQFSHSGWGPYNVFRRLKILKYFLLHKESITGLRFLTFC